MVGAVFCWLMLSGCSLVSRVGKQGSTGILELIPDFLGVEKIWVCDLLACKPGRWLKIGRVRV